MSDETIKTMMEKSLVDHEPTFKYSISVDCVIFGYDEGVLKVLLIESDQAEYLGKWSLLGDVLQQGENLDQASQRVLQERTGLDNMFLEQVKTFSEINRHPAGRVITTAYLSLVNVKDYKLKSVDNALHWHPVSELETMAFDHKLILDTCLEVLRKKIQQEPIIFNLLEKKFSLRKLQQVFEEVLGISFDRRNFRKKLFSTGMLVDENEMESDVHHRPGKLYSFNRQAFESYKVKTFVGLQF